MTIYSLDILLSQSWTMCCWWKQIVHPGSLHITGSPDWLPVGLFNMFLHLLVVGAKTMISFRSKLGAKYFKAAAVSLLWQQIKRYLLSSCLSVMLGFQCHKPDPFIIKFPPAFHPLALAANHDCSPDALFCYGLQNGDFIILSLSYIYDLELFYLKIISSTI